MTRADMEKLARDIVGRHYVGEHDVESMVGHIATALTQVREATIVDVLRGIDREQAYHEFLEEKGEMRHPILACKSIRSWVRALKESP